MARSNEWNKFSHLFKEEEIPSRTAADKKRKKWLEGLEKKFACLQ
jgi:hypothetical protein